jgi:hypothetical protein
MIEQVDAISSLGKLSFLTELTHAGSMAAGA